MAGSQLDGEFSEFVTARYTGLVRTAFLLTGDRGHAEDLVQASLLRTLRAWPRLRAPDHADAYTRTTMVRLASRWQRRRWSGEMPVADPPAMTSVDVVAGVDDVVRVRAALAALPWGQRAVLVLKYLDDLPDAEVAAYLGCSVGTVKSRASRGLEALRKAGSLNDDLHNLGEVLDD